MAPVLFERWRRQPALHDKHRQPTGAAAGLDAGCRCFGVPHDVRRFIDRQIDDIAESDHVMLSAASVVGREFATTVVAAALECDVDSVESCLRATGAARHFHCRGGGGRVAGWHAGRPLLVPARSLSRAAVRASAGKPARLEPRTLGRRLEAAWSGRLDEIAASSRSISNAVTNRARDPPSPARRRQGATSQRQRRSDPSSAPRTRCDPARRRRCDRTRIEVELRVALGAAFITTRGFGAPEVLDAYARAEALCERLGERADLFPAIWGNGCIAPGAARRPKGAGWARGCLRWRKNSTTPA